MGKIWWAFIFYLAITEVILESNTRRHILARLIGNRKLVENVQSNVDEVSFRSFGSMLGAAISCGVQLLGWGCGGICGNRCSPGGWNGGEAIWNGPNSRHWNVPGGGRDDALLDANWGAIGGKGNVPNEIVIGGNGGQGNPLGKIEFGIVGGHGVPPDRLNIGGVNLINNERENINWNGNCNGYGCGRGKKHMGFSITIG